MPQTLRDKKKIEKEASTLVDEFITSNAKEKQMTEDDFVLQIGLKEAADCLDEMVAQVGSEPSIEEKIAAVAKEASTPPATEQKSLLDRIKEAAGGEPSGTEDPKPENKTQTLAEKLKGTVEEKTASSGIIDLQAMVTNARNKLYSDKK